MCEDEQDLAADERIQQLAAVWRGGACPDCLCGGHCAGQIGLEDERPPEFLRDDGALNGGSAKAAGLLGESRPEPAQLGELVPVRATEALVVASHELTLLETVLFLAEPPDIVAERGLFC